VGLGLVYVDRFMPFAELEGIVPPVLGGLGGAMVGAGVGTWLALKMRGYERSGWSGTIAAVLAPFVLGAALAPANGFLERLLGSGSTQWTFPILGMTGAALTAVFARAVTRRKNRDGWAEPPRSLTETT
jgi:MFS family permease